MDRRKPTENEIEISILKYLTSRGFFARKNYDQANKVNGAFKKNQWQIRGMADIIVFNKRVIFLEVKTERGTQSPHQIQFEKDCKEHRIPYFVVRTAKEALTAVQSVLVP